MSIALKLKLLDEVPVVKKQKAPSKYELELRRFILSRKPAASVKVPSAKQANTVTSSFRRAIRESSHPVKVEKRGTEIILIRINTEGED